MLITMIFLHNGATGDIVYSLPSAIAMGGGHYQVKKPGQFRLLKRLLEAQPYLTQVSHYNKLTGYAQFGDQPFFDFDRYREHPRVKRFYDHPEEAINIAKAHLETANVHFDLAQQWLFNIEPKTEADIVIHKTEKYRNFEGKNYIPTIDWTLLEAYADRCVFVGYEKEQKIFNRWYTDRKFEVPWYGCQDIYEMAQIIAGSKMFIGNQSIGFAAAEGMKHPRVQETCLRIPNCLPHGKDGHTELSIELIEKYLNRTA